MTEEGDSECYRTFFKPACLKKNSHRWGDEEDNSNGKMYVRSRTYFLLLSLLPGLGEEKPFTSKLSLVLGPMAVHEWMSVGSSSKHAVITSQSALLEQPSKNIRWGQWWQTRALMLWSQALEVLYPKFGKQSQQGNRRSKTTAPRSKTTAPQRNPQLAANLFPCELVTNAGEKLFAMTSSFAMLVIMPPTLFFFREQSLVL